MNLKRSLKRDLCLGLLFLPGLAIILAGCGGGGSDNSGPALGPLQVTGAIQANAAAPGAPAAVLSGYTVNFDHNAKVTATTDANGAFTISVPRSIVTGTDTLSVTDPNGVLVEVLTVPANTTALNNFDAGTVSVSPPGAPLPANL